MQIAGICACLVLIGVSDSQGAYAGLNHQADVNSQGFIGSHDFTTKRMKRAFQDGLIEFIIRNARHIYSDGLRDVYRKQGSYANALEDFYATRPNNVQDLLSLPYIKEGTGHLAQLHKMGDIGTRRIYTGIEQKTAVPVVIISKAQQPGVLDKLIKYTTY